tara:strand:+ start:111 stop:317 length:207 start_codon:yes stop_codon:yes gene_type:complete
MIKQFGRWLFNIQPKRNKSWVGIKIQSTFKPQPASYNEVFKHIYNQLDKEHQTNVYNNFVNIIEFSKQ